MHSRERGRGRVSERIRKRSYLQVLLPFVSKLSSQLRSGDEWRVTEPVHDKAGSGSGSGRGNGKGSGYGNGYGDGSFQSAHFPYGYSGCGQGSGAGNGYGSGACDGREGWQPDVRPRLTIVPISCSVVDVTVRREL